MEPLISLKDVTISYERNEILSDVSLDIHAGEYIGIFGPNGSGKTTLLKTMLRLLKPVKGEVKVYGKNNFKKIKSDISYVPQNPSVDKSFPATVQEVVEMGLYGKLGFLKPLKEKDHKLAEEALHNVHMGVYRHRPIGHLSGGELQKVMVARALVSKPKVILLDEPTSSLDFVMTKDLMELLEELNEKYSITIVVVHHHIDLLLPYCSRVLLLNHRIVYDGPPENDVVNEKIRQIFTISNLNQ